MKDFNKVTVTLSFAPDKWVGLEAWRDDVALLRKLLERMGMNDGRRSMMLAYEDVSVDELEGWGV
jgi:hypothetical protein